MKNENFLSEYIGCEVIGTNLSAHTWNWKVKRYSLNTLNEIKGTTR
jgi:hypothetical protein